MVARYGSIIFHGEHPGCLPWGPEDVSIIFGSHNFWDDTLKDLSGADNLQVTQVAVEGHPFHGALA